MALSEIALRHADDGHSRLKNISGEFVRNMVRSYSPDDTNQEVGSFRGLGYGRCKRLKFVKKPYRHFVFTCSDNFEVGCIV